MNYQVKTPPTNAERDAAGTDTRCTDPRFDAFPDARVVICYMGGSVPGTVNNDWSYFATLDSGQYIYGDNYVSKESAIERCLCKLEIGVWNPPIVEWEKTSTVVDAQLLRLDPIPEAKGELKDFLDNWSKRFG